MIRVSRFLRTAAFTTGLVAATACSDTVDIVSGDRPADPLFATYVALGNSITAGYQSGGINDSTQRESFAFLLSQQMKTRFAYPSLVYPGCAPPINNFQTQARIGGGSATTCALRAPGSVTDHLNNVAVPGAMSFDLFSPSSSASNTLTTLILGGKTQLQKAREANPTFFSLWIGNNDVLRAAGSGLLTPTPNVSPGITPLADFQENLDSIGRSLAAIPTLKGGVLIGVVQVAAAPILFPGRILVDQPAFKTAFDSYAGTTTVIHPSCVGSSSLISFAIIPAIRSGDHPAVVACSPGAIPTTPVGDIFVLDATEQSTISARVTAYNNHIASIANARGWAYWDPNPLLVSMKGSGCISTIPNLASATQPYGACVTLDGVHPSGVAHRQVANALIAVINTKYGTALTAVPSP